MATDEFDIEKLFVDDAYQRKFIRPRNRCPEGRQPLFPAISSPFRR